MQALWASFAFVGLGLAQAGGSCAADPVPPAQAVLPNGEQTGPVATPSAPPAPISTARLGAHYAELVPGLLARSVFATTEAGAVEIEFLDVLVAPGRLVQDKS